LNNAYANYERTSGEEQYALVKPSKNFMKSNPLRSIFWLWKCLLWF